MQVVFRVYSISLVSYARSVYRAESVACSQWCSVFARLQSTAFMVCLLSFSVGSVQSSIQWSVGFRVYSVQCQFSVCTFRVCTVQWAILRLYSLVSALFKSTGCSPRVCHVHVMFRVHTLNVLCPCAVLEF